LASSNPVTTCNFPATLLEASAAQAHSAERHFRDNPPGWFDIALHRAM
jgi:hypothetical protein